MSILKDEGKLGGRLLKQLILASFRHLCRDLRQDEICFIKPNRNGGRICPEINEILPKVINIFICRQTACKVLQSIERMLKAPGSGMQETLHFQVFSPLRPLAQILNSYMRYDACYRIPSS